jgi:hypothetical protein
MDTTQVGPFLLELDSSEATLEQVGGKGASLARLAAAGLPVPPGFHLTTSAYRRFVAENQFAGAILGAAAPAKAEDLFTLDHASAQIQSLILQGAIPGDIAESVRRGYADLGADDPPVAVRSSATAEDLPEMSFAGQQETYLNVHGAESVLEAVRRCWASLWTARALGYRARQGIRSEEVSLAVVVQQLVAADVAGILFTANPLTGAREEVMINAAWGLGEAIVGGKVTPDTLIVSKQTGEIVSQEIADKAVMTVRSAEGTQEAPVPAARRRQAALQPAQAAELARLGVQIEQLYGLPMDIEWAMQGKQFFILQARPITALPEPRATLDWTLPRPNGRYARSSVIELLPDPLSPLFATLGLPLLSDAMRRLGQSIGLGGMMRGPMLVTLHDYAYYDVTAFGGSGMFRALPRLIPASVRMLGRAQTRWADEARPRYAEVVGAWAAHDLDAMPATQLVEGVREIVLAAADHYLAIQSGILPVAYMSEALFTSVYNRFIKRRGDPTALTFLLGFDSVPIQAEKSLYDLAKWARTQPALADFLAQATGPQIVAATRSPSPPIADGETWLAFCRRFTQHLDRFGHTVYDLDFAKSLPADDPAPLLETLKYFLTGQAQSPYERQSAAATAREQAVQSLLTRRKGLRRRLFRQLVASAQRYAPLREDALADVGLGWPLLRRMCREVGQRSVAAGALAERDVCWTRARPCTIIAMWWRNGARRGSANAR